MSRRSNVHNCSLEILFVFCLFFVLFCFLFIYLSATQDNKATKFIILFRCFSFFCLAHLLFDSSRPPGVTNFVCMCVEMNSSLFAASFFFLSLLIDFFDWEEGENGF